MRTLLLLLSISLAATAAAADRSLLNRKAPDFSFHDQYDRLFTLQTFSGRPLVLMACDKQASKKNGEWRTAILDRYAGRGVHTAGVANLRSVPSFFAYFIKKDLKKDPVSILLDWDGSLFSSYGLAKNVPNIIVIDASGVVRYLYSGLSNSEAAEQLFNTVDGLINGSQTLPLH